MNKFTATYTVNGIELNQTSQAYPTDRCLPNNPDYKLFEMKAAAEDKGGNRYHVTWIFEDNGEESYDEYDYSQPNDCTLCDLSIPDFTKYGLKSASECNNR